MASLRVITREEMAKHKKGSDCWVTMYDIVLDMNDYAKEHPGGMELVYALAGGKCEEEFEDTGHTDEARLVCWQYAVGMLEGSKFSEEEAKAKLISPSATERFSQSLKRSLNGASRWINGKSKDESCVPMMVGACAMAVVGFLLIRK